MKTWKLPRRRAGDLCYAARGVPRGVGGKPLMHHREQIGVYVRLLDVAVPGLTDRSADGKQAKPPGPRTRTLVPARSGGHDQVVAPSALFDSQAWPSHRILTCVRRRVMETTGHTLAVRTPPPICTLSRRVSSFSGSRPRRVKLSPEAIRRSGRRRSK